MHAGAIVSSAVTVAEALEDQSLPLLILNPACYPQEELFALRGRNASVIEFGKGATGCAFGEKPAVDNPRSWLEPLPAREVSEKTVSRYARMINDQSPVRPEDPSLCDLRLVSYLAEDGSRVVVAINDRPTYLRARILADGRVSTAAVLTSNVSLPVAVEPLTGDGGALLKVKIPPSGAVALSLGLMDPLDVGRPRAGASAGDVLTSNDVLLARKKRR